MPRLPRDCSYKRLLKLLGKYGYKVTRTTGSHIRIHSDIYNHSLTVPAHDSLKIGTLNSILNEVSSKTGIDKHIFVSEL